MSSGYCATWISGKAPPSPKSSGARGTKPWRWPYGGGCFTAEQGARNHNRDLVSTGRELLGGARNEPRAAAGDGTSSAGSSTSACVAKAGNTLRGCGNNDASEAMEMAAKWSRAGVVAGVVVGVVAGARREEHKREEQQRVVAEELQ